MALKSKIVNRYKKGDIWILLAVFIGVLAVLRYFYALLGDYYTFLDEYPTFDAAVGFFKTGKFYKWDFYTDTLSDIAYSRAWPHTILLTLWFHIFGISVPAGKALSAKTALQHDQIIKLFEVIFGRDYMLNKFAR